ncbi:hypothetical protein LXL04_027424 [Taraxacum kok-saghyz]
MDDIYEPETIDVQLDEYFKIKPISRCRDEFLNNLCEKNDDEIRLPGNDEVLDEDDNGEENDEEEEEEKEEGSDEVSAEETIRDYRFPYATHNPQVKCNVVKPFIGERYESRHQLKLCLTNYSISKGYQIRFKKCDSVRLVAVCASPTGKNNCPFLCRASWMSTEDSSLQQNPRRKLEGPGRRGRRGRGGRSGSRGRGGGRGTRGRGGESVPNYTAESDDVSKYAEDEEVFEKENEAANLDEDAEDDLGDEEGYNTTTAEDIKRHIHDLKFSGYTDEEIMETLGLTEEEYNEHVGVKQVPVQLDQDVGNHLDDTQEITVVEVGLDQEGLDDGGGGMDEVGLDQEGLDDGGGGMDEVGLDQEGLHDGGGIDEIIPEEMIVPVNTRRRPSEKIIKIKLRTPNYGKDGKGRTADHPFSLD